MTSSPPSNVPVGPDTISQSFLVFVKYLKLLIYIEIFDIILVIHVKNM